MLIFFRGWWWKAELVRGKEHTIACLRSRQSSTLPHSPSSSSSRTAPLTKSMQLHSLLLHYYTCIGVRLSPPSTSATQARKQTNNKKQTPPMNEMNEGILSCIFLVSSSLSLSFVRVDFLYDKYYEYYVVLLLRNIEETEEEEKATHPLYQLPVAAYYY